MGVDLPSTALQKASSLPSLLSRSSRRGARGAGAGACPWTRFTCLFLILMCFLLTLLFWFMFYIFIRIIRHDQVGDYPLCLTEQLKDPSKGVAGRTLRKFFIRIKVSIVRVKLCIKFLALSFFFFFFFGSNPKVLGFKIRSHSCAMFSIVSKAVVQLVITPESRIQPLYRIDNHTGNM